MLGRNIRSTEKEIGLGTRWLFWAYQENVFYLITVHLQGCTVGLINSADVELLVTQLLLCAGRKEIIFVISFIYIKKLAYMRNVSIQRNNKLVNYCFAQEHFDFVKSN